MHFLVGGLTILKNSCHAVINYFKLLLSLKVQCIYVKINNK